jgi:hypothetical protein
MSILIGWIIVGIGGTIYAAMRGGGLLKWLFIGIIFGPFALVHAVVSCVRCPSCDKRVNTKATMCPFCKIKMPDRKSAIDMKHCAIELTLFAIIIALSYSAIRMGYLKDAVSQLPIVSYLNL